MAVDVCSEIVWSCGSSPGISPRISFSHDLKGCDHVPVETCLVASDSARDFDFCITASQFFLELSRPADELFADGKILPMPMIRTRSHAMRSDPDPPKHPAIKGSLSIEGRTPRVQDSPPPAEKKQLKELLLFDPEESPRRATKSFWSFSRSSSLNCESQRSKGLIRSLQFLARSNSTGSVLNANPDGNNSISKGNSKKGQQQCTGRRSVSLSATGSTAPRGSEGSRRSYGGGGGGGMRVSPVLNFHSPVSIGNVGLFGIGSFFCGSTRRLKKKKK
ncbi:hypothetical protein MLD38_040444 [Melastoma candidum]|nr:hypothetical protein MLD38_040832 [Melastoma candidum]KAI4298120.1 hypothetical protein MLD38_040444 [Melastoma candidum]